MHFIVFSDSFVREIQTNKIKDSFSYLHSVISSRLSPLIWYSIKSWRREKKIVVVCCCCGSNTAFFVDRRCSNNIYFSVRHRVTKTQFSVGQWLCAMWSWKVLFLSQLRNSTLSTYSSVSLCCSSNGSLINACMIRAFSGLFAYASQIQHCLRCLNGSNILRAMKWNNVFHFIALKILIAKANFWHLYYEKWNCHKSQSTEQPFPFSLTSQ